MDDAGAVRPFERMRRLEEVVHDLAGGERFAPRQHALQILAAEQVHHQKRCLRLRVDSCVGHPDDVVTLERTGDLGLALEARAEPLILEEAREHHLERPVGVRPLVEDLVDRAHSARLDAADDPVTIVEHLPRP
jgi:hypothetical protein